MLLDGWFADGCNFAGVFFWETIFRNCGIQFCFYWRWKPCAWTDKISLKRLLGFFSGGDDFESAHSMKQKWGATSTYLKHILIQLMDTFGWRAINGQPFNLSHYIAHTLYMQLKRIRSGANARTKDQSLPQGNTTLKITPDSIFAWDYSELLSWPALLFRLKLVSSGATRVDYMPRQWSGK